MYTGADMSFDFESVTNDLSAIITIVPKLSYKEFTYSKT